MIRRSGVLLVALATCLLAVPAVATLAIMVAPSTTQVLYGVRSRWDLDDADDAR